MIPLTDLTAQYLSFKHEIETAISYSLRSGSFILGPDVEAFEREMAEYCDTTSAVGVASGTDALYLALLACGIGEGDEVLTTTFSFIATAEAITRCGATPVFVDIEPDTCNMNLDLLERHVTRATRAIVPVHLFGLPLDMSRLMDFALAHNLIVVEDCAQSLGATWRGKKTGSYGNAGCLSFFPSKVLGAYGDGGMVVTSDSAIAEHVRTLRHHGASRKYHHDVHGCNSRLDSLQAAVLRTKLPHVDKWIELRRELAEGYAKDLGRIDSIQLPAERNGTRHVYNYYTIRIRGGVERRDALAAHLRGQGISTGVYYPKSLHLQPVYTSLGYAYGDLPASESAQDEVLSLPMYPELELAQVQQVSRAIMSCPAMRTTDWARTG